MLSTASKYPKKNLDCSLTLQNLSQKERLGFESDVYHFDTCPRLLGLKENCGISTKNADETVEEFVVGSFTMNDLIEEIRRAYSPTSGIKKKFPT